MYTHLTFYMFQISNLEKSKKEKKKCHIYIYNPVGILLAAQSSLNPAILTHSSKISITNAYKLFTHTVC